MRNEKERVWWISVDIELTHSTPTAMTRIEDHSGAGSNRGPPGLVSWAYDEDANEGPPGLVSSEDSEEDNGGPPGLVSSEDDEHPNRGPPGLLSSEDGEDSTRQVPDSISLSESCDDEEMSVEDENEAEQTREQQMRQVLPELVSTTSLVGVGSVEELVDRLQQSSDQTTEFQVVYSDSDSVFVVVRKSQ